MVRSWLMKWKWKPATLVPSVKAEENMHITVPRERDISVFFLIGDDFVQRGVRLRLHGHAPHGDIVEGAEMRTK